MTPDGISEIPGCSIYQAALKSVPCLEEVLTGKPARRGGVCEGTGRNLGYLGREKQLGLGKHPSPAPLKE